MRRRTYLTGTAAILGSVAGCLGGGDDGGDGETGSNGGEDQPGDTDATRSEQAEQTVIGYFQNLDDGAPVDQYRRSLEDSDGFWSLFERDVRNTAAGIADVDVEKVNESDERVTVVADIDWRGNDERTEFVAEVGNFDENSQIVSLQPSGGDFPDAEIQDVELRALGSEDSISLIGEFLVEGDFQDGELQLFIEGAPIGGTLRPDDFQNGSATVTADLSILRGGNVPFDVAEFHNTVSDSTGTLEGVGSVSVELAPLAGPISFYNEDIPVNATLNVEITDVTIGDLIGGDLNADVTAEVTNTGTVPLVGSLYIGSFAISEFNLDPSDSMTVTQNIISSGTELDTRATAFVGPMVAGSRQIQLDPQFDASIERLEFEVVEDEVIGPEVERLLLEIENTGEIPLPEDSIVVTLDGEELSPVGFDQIEPGERVTYDDDDIFVGVPEETNTLKVEIMVDGEVLDSAEVTASI